MNSPARSRGLLQYYRSQVGTTTQNKSPTSAVTNNARFKQSLVPHLSQNNNQIELRQFGYKDNVSYPQPYTQRNTIRGYQHLLSPRVRANNSKPLSTYRSIERFSPRQYQKDSEVEMEENRSVKFIEKLREEIGGRRGDEGRCREGGDKGELGGKGYRERKGGLVESKVNENTMRSLELCSPPRMKPRRQQQQQQQERQAQSPSPQTDQSPLKQSFQQKLVSRCKSLETQLQFKQTQLSNFSKQLSSLQHKHTLQVSSLRSKHQQQLCKVKNQLQIKSRQLEELEKSYKAIERAKNVKEKAMAEEIAKYVRQVKEKEQERNRLGLELEELMRERREKGITQLMAKESTNENKGLSKQIQQLKGRVSQLQLQLQSTKQQRQDIFQQSKLLNLQLQNYLKWNQQLSTLNRSLQQQLHQFLSQQKYLQQQLQANNTKLQQYQSQTIGEKDSLIASLKSQLNSTSQQLEIMKFQGQSLKNQMEVKEGQFKRQQARLQQELEVTEVRLMGNIREKQHLAQQLQYNRKELANVRRLCDQLQSRLQEERRDGQELQIIKDRLELESKQVRNTLTLVQQRNIHLQNQINQLTKHSHQIQQQLKLANHQTNLPTQQQQQPSFLVQQRLSLLQSQLRQLQAKYRQQKQNLSVQYESQLQQHKRIIMQLQKQLFRRQENALDDQRRYKVQQLKLEDSVKQLEQQLMIKSRELSQITEENNVKDVKVRHLIKKLEDLNQTYERKIAAKETELTDLKLFIKSQVTRIKQYYLERIEVMCQEITKHMMVPTNPSQSNQQSVQHMITSCTSLSQSRGLSPQKHRQQRQRQISRPLLGQNGKASLHQGLSPQQLQRQLHTRTFQITCYLSHLHKKTILYQTTISKLQHQVRQLPLKVQQKYTSRVSQLQQALKKEEGKLSQMKQRHQSQVQQQKQRHQRQVQRIKNTISSKEEQIQQLKQAINDIKKLNDNLEQTMQQKEKQLKRNVKKLSSELEQYKAKYNGLLELGKQLNGGVDAIGQQQQGQESRLQSPSPMANRNNMSSMTTVNLNNNNNVYTKSQHNQPNNINKPLFNPNPTSPSLQQLLQTRLNQLTLHNQHLSHQLNLTTTQLHRQRQHTIELTDIIRQLEVGLQKEIQQNRLLGGKIQRLQGEYHLNSEKLLKVDRVNTELQGKLKQMVKNKELCDIQISQISSKLKATTQFLRHKQHQIKQLNKLIQNHTKTQQQTIAQTNKYKQQLTHKNQQLQTSISTLTHSLKQTQQNLTQTQTKLTMLQNLYQQLLRSFQHLPNTSPCITKPHQPQPPHSNQQQYITSLTSSFTNKLQALHHTIEEFKQINEGLKTEILRHRALVEQKALEVLKRETEIQQLKDKLNQMKKHVNRLEVEVEEWKFIAQSNSLNKSLSLQLHLRNSQITTHNRHQLKDPFHLSTVSKPQKEKCSRTKSPLKPPSPNTLHSPQRNPFCSPSIKNQNSPYFQQYENKDLKGSVDSMNSEIGQVHQYQNRRNHNNLGGSAAEMSFF